MEIPATPSTAPQQHTPDLLLVHVGHTIWDNLPVLLLSSMLLVTVAYPALFLATTVSWLVGWPLLMLCLCPIWAGTIAASDRLLDGDVVSARALLALIRRSIPTGLRIGSVPAAVGTMLLAALQLLASSEHAWWIAAPFLLGVGMALVIAISLVPVFSLANQTDLRGPALWLTSAGIAFRQPVPVLGTLTLLGMMVWTSMMLGPAVLIASAPLGLLCAGIIRQAQGRLHCGSAT